MLKIVSAPNKVLTSASIPVEKIDQKIYKLVMEMEQTLVSQKDPQGVGLAAPQVGIGIQLFIVKPRPHLKTDELKAEIKSIIEDKNGKYEGYWMPRKNFFLTRFLKKGGIYPDYTIRLYKNGAAKFPCKSVHENVDINGEVGYLKNDLLHYADPEFSRYLKRWHRYTGLDADMLIQKGERPGFFSYVIFKPWGWFLKTYFRHKGFMDGFPGFVFALFSSLRFISIYVKYHQRKHK